MDETKEKLFMELLFEKMKETLEQLGIARRQRFRLEAECINLQQEMRLLEQRRAYYEAKEAENVVKESTTEG